MIKQSISNLRRHQFEKMIKDEKCETVEEVVDMVFGTRYNDYDTDVVIKSIWAKTPKPTFIQRLNSLWVYPLFIALIPVRYLLFGRYSVSEDSKSGRILIFLLGELK